MSVARILVGLLLGCALLAPASDRARAQSLEKAMEEYTREQIAKARADCASKLAIARLPDNDIDGVARYGADKWFAYKDCLADELIVQHLPARK